MATDLPPWLSGRLDKAGYDKIEDAIRRAELKTSGEIVPVLTQRSSTVGHVPIILLLLFCFTFLHMFTLPGTEDIDPLYLLGGEILVTLILTRCLAPLEFVERWLTPKKDQAYQVEQRAEVEFFESHIKKTENNTGVLLFFSLMERRAVVLADKSISDKLPADTWKGVVNQMVDGIKKKDLSEGICQGIDACGDLLAKHFPRPEGDVNELPNHLQIR